MKGLFAAMFYCAGPIIKGTVIIAIVHGTMSKPLLQNSLYCILGLGKENFIVLYNAMRMRFCLEFYYREETRSSDRRPDFFTVSSRCSPAAISPAAHQPLPPALASVMPPSSSPASAGKVQ
nr:hypothetical protein Iba_chr09aCG16200 [Ipomoea batatas]